MSPGSRPLAAVYAASCWSLPGQPCALADVGDEVAAGRGAERSRRPASAPGRCGCRRAWPSPSRRRHGSGRRCRPGSCRAGSRRARSRPPTGPRPRRHLLGEQPVQLVGVGVLAGLRALELLAPAAYLPLQEALRPAELAEPDGRRVDGVQRGQHLDQPVGDRGRCARCRARRARPPCGRRCRRPAPSRRTAPRARRVVGAVRVGAGDRYVGVGQRATSRCTRGPCRARSPGRGPAAGGARSTTTCRR